MAFGSLNNMLAGSSAVVPEVGMGATNCGWTDRYPYTIIWVSKSGKTIRVQEDHAKRIDNNGMSECQKYEFTPNPEARIYTVRLCKKGWKSKEAGKFVIGYRSAYHDYSF